MTPSRLVKLPTFQRSLVLPSSGSKKYFRSPFTNSHGIICHNISIFKLNVLFSSLTESSYYNLKGPVLIICRCSLQKLLPSKVHYVTTEKTTTWSLLPLKPQILYSTDGWPSLALLHISRF